MSNRLYHYIPSQALAITSLVLFALITIPHGVQVYRRRCYFFIPFLIGGLCEVGGYAARLSSMQDLDAVGPYIAQSLLLLLPAIFYSASIYMTLKKLIVFLKAEQHSLLSIRRLTPILVWADGISLFVQASGGGLQSAGGEKLPKIGQWVTIFGLGIQVVSFTFFLFLTARFHMRVKAQGDARIVNYDNQGTPRRATWELLIYTMYTSGILILIRSIYRLAEYATGREGYLMLHEAYFYGFDTLLMFLVMVIFIIFHPAHVLEGRSDVVPLTDGGRESDLSPVNSMYKSPPQSYQVSK